MSNRKIKRIFIKQLDAINSRSKVLAKKMGEDSIPLVTFKFICNNVKLEIGDEPLLNKLVDEFNKTMDVMYDSAADQAKTFGKKTVKLALIKSMVEKTKGGFNQSYDGEV